MSNNWNGQQVQTFGPASGWGQPGREQLGWPQPAQAPMQANWGAPVREQQAWLQPASWQPVWEQPAREQPARDAASNQEVARESAWDRVEHRLPAWAPAGYQASPVPAARRSAGAIILIAFVVLIGLGSVVAGGAYLLFGTTAAAVPGAASAPGATEPGAGAPPACPFTADQVSALVGQPMVDSGNCRFGDGNGVAAISVEAHSAAAAQATYGYQRDRATKVYTQVTDLLPGGTGYVAYSGIEAEAVLIGPDAGYTVVMSSFARLGDAGYEPVLRDVVAALPR